MAIDVDQSHLQHQQVMLVDDHNRVMWVYLMKTKDEAFHSFKKFRSTIENKIGEKLKVLRTDREGELCQSNSLSTAVKLDWSATTPHHTRHNRTE